MKFINLALICILASGSAYGAKKEQQPLETKVAWTNNCPSDPPKPSAEYKALILAAAAAVIVPKLISGAIDASATYLKAAGESKSLASSGRLDGDFYIVTDTGDLKLNPTMGCLVVVRGRFQGKVSDASYSDWADNYPSLAGLQELTFRLEARLVPLNGLDYFQLKPVYLQVAKFEESAWFKNTRDYSLGVTLLSPGAVTPFASAEFKFKALGEGPPMIEGDWRLAGATSLPMALPAEMDDAKKAKIKQEKNAAPYLLAYDILYPNLVTKAKQPQPSPYNEASVSRAANDYCRELSTLNASTPKKFAIDDDSCAYTVNSKRSTLDAALKAAARSQAQVDWAASICGSQIPEMGKKEGRCKKFTPSAPVEAGFFSTSVSLVETKEGSKFAAFLGNALSASKDDLSSLIQKNILPDQKNAAKAAAEKTERMGRQGVLLSDLAVEQAENLLTEAGLADPLVPSDVTAARASLLKAKIASNEAYRVAGTPVPYPHLE